MRKMQLQVERSVRVNFSQEVVIIIHTVHIFTYRVYASTHTKWHECAHEWVWWQSARWLSACVVLVTSPCLRADFCRLKGRPGGGAGRSGGRSGGDSGLLKPSVCNAYPCSSNNFFLTLNKLHKGESANLHRSIRISRRFRADCYIFQPAATIDRLQLQLQPQLRGTYFSYGSKMSPRWLNASVYAVSALAGACAQNDISVPWKFDETSAIALRPHRPRCNY
jgi:hypothetical protein